MYRWLAYPPDHHPPSRMTPSRRHALAERLVLVHDRIALPAYMLSTFVTILGFALGWWHPGPLQALLLVIPAWFGGYTAAILVLHWLARHRQHDPH